MRRLLASSFLACAMACTPDSGLTGSTSFGDGDDDDDGTSNGNGAGSGEGASTGSFDGTGGAGAGAEECAGDTAIAEAIPLMMFITFDKSGSMENDNKWSNATNALKAFFGDPAAADLLVALRFYPRNGCDESSCNINACATPDVPVGPLTAAPAPGDTQENALITAIDFTDPGGATPTAAALQGAIQFSTQYSQQNPDQKAVVILVTDGEPNGCGEDIGFISNIAAGGLVDGVPTYTIGLQGSNEGQMAQIAQAGGGSSFIIGNGNTTQDLLTALQAIQGEQLACEYAVPLPSNGQPLNPQLVNVKFTPSGGMEQTLGNVADASACGTGMNWYYDDPMNPTTIFLCPAACDAAKADDQGQIAISVGCQTIPG
jgi:hypothetical protein